MFGSATAKAITLAWLPAIWKASPFSHRQSHTGSRLDAASNARRHEQVRIDKAKIDVEGRQEITGFFERALLDNHNVSTRRVKFISDACWRVTAAAFNISADDETASVTFAEGAGLRVRNTGFGDSNESVINPGGVFATPKKCAPERLQEPNVTSRDLGVEPSCFIARVSKGNKTLIIARRLESLEPDEDNNETFILSDKTSWLGDLESRKVEACLNEISDLEASTAHGNLFHNNDSDDLSDESDDGNEESLYDNSCDEDSEYSENDGEEHASEDETAPSDHSDDKSVYDDDDYNNKDTKSNLEVPSWADTFVKSIYLRHLTLYKADAVYPELIWAFDPTEVDVSTAQLVSSHAVKQHYYLLPLYHRFLTPND